MIRCQIPVASPYEVLIEAGLLSKAGEIIAKMFPTGRTVVVTDSHVATLNLSILLRSLKDAGITCETYIVPAGEASKNWEQLGCLVNFLGEKQLSRADYLIALGGGVIGDLTGFAASIYLRGIPYVQIPTTLLATVDSSVGGKTAVNLDSGKNQAGTFWQPSLVLCDTKVLQTLPPAVLGDGLAESLKYGVIGDAALFHNIADGGMATNPEELIAACVSMKGELVGQDEKDHGLRQYLNLGHTFGHTIEACSHFAISHGHGVAIGMVMAAKAAARLFPDMPSCEEEIVLALKKLGLPTGCPYPASELIPWLSSDKKRRGDSITLVLPRRIGQCELCPIPVEDANALLSDILS